MFAWRLMQGGTALFGAYLLWTFKNTPWAATSFIAYVIVLIGEGIIADRLRSSLKVGSALTSASASPSDRDGLVVPLGTNLLRGGGHGDLVPQDPPFTLAGTLRAVATVTCLMIASDFAILLHWFDFETAGQSGWTVAAKMIATLIAFGAMFLGPFVNAFMLGFYVMERLEAMVPDSDGISGAAAFIGGGLGWLIGLATFAHLALVPYLNHIGLVEVPR